MFLLSLIPEVWQLVALGTTPTPTVTSTPTLTFTFKTTATASQTLTSTPSPTLTLTPSPTHTFTPTPSRTPTLTPSSTTTPTPTPFEIFGNFHPTLLMGDMGDIQVLPADLTDCQGRCYQVIFTPLGNGNIEGLHTCSKGILTQKTCSWTGIYWVHPEGNDGSMSDGKGECTLGYDLSNYSTLKLRARSVAGNVTVSFMTGGVGKVNATPPPCPDLFYIPPVMKTLTSDDWVEIILKIDDRDRSHVIGGLGITMSWLDNMIVSPDSTPRRIYIDNVRFEH